jgi:hypothetical protein
MKESFDAASWRHLQTCEIALQTTADHFFLAMDVLCLGMILSQAKW